MVPWFHIEFFEAEFRKKRHRIIYRRDTAPVKVAFSTNYPKCICSKAPKLSLWSWTLPSRRLLSHRNRRKLERRKEKKSNQFNTHIPSFLCLSIDLSCQNWPIYACYLDIPLRHHGSPSQLPPASIFPSLPSPSLSPSPRIGCTTLPLSSHILHLRGGKNYGFH